MDVNATLHSELPEDEKGCGVVDAAMKAKQDALLMLSLLSNECPERE